MKKKLLLFAGFFILLMAAFYCFLFWGTDYYKARLPVLGYIPDFSLVGQDGKVVSQHNVEGKVYVAEYFFTTCKGICPKMNMNMKGIFDHFKDEGGFAIVSHTSMPETDSVPVMKAYEEKMLGASPSFTAKWYFVTGTKDSLYKLAQQYLLDNDKNNSINIKDHFIHTQFFSLVDKQRRVRGIYDGLKPDELERMKVDIVKLLKEPEDKGSFNHSPFNNNPA
jgi:protein SCO1